MGAWKERERESGLSDPPFAPLGVSEYFLSKPQGGNHNKTWLCGAPQPSQSKVEVNPNIKTMNTKEIELVELRRIASVWNIVCR